MDLLRAPEPRTRRRAVAWGAAATGVLVLVLLGTRSSSLPSIRLDEVTIDTVRRAPLVMEVRAAGTLVPEHIRWITSQTSARVERLAAESGREVTEGDLLIEMSNPDLQIEALQAEQQVRRAEVELLNLRTSLRGAILSQVGLVAEMRTRRLRAVQDASTAAALRDREMISRHDATLRAAEAEEASTRLRIEEERLALFRQGVDSQLAVQAAQVRQLEAIARNQAARLRSLLVRAPEDGVVQDLDLQLGQWVPEGATLAAVTQPGALKSVLRIPEFQAADVVIGQSARIDIRGTAVAGRVTRKDPAANQSTVTVDVALEEALPAGAVAALGVQGVIRLQEIDDALLVGRPLRAPQTGRTTVFRLDPDGRTATRVVIELGRGAVTLVEVVRGLAAGDRIIVSDLSSFDDVDRIRLR